MTGDADERRATAWPVMADAPSLDELRAEARYHRERYDLYRAKMYALRPTTMTRLRELELAHRTADARLRRAEQARKSPLTGG